MRMFVTSFYKFLPLTDLAECRAEFRKVCAALGLKGTVLIAPEGLNGSLWGSQESLEAFQDWIHRRPHCADVTFKTYASPEPAFRRMLVKLKREIVTMQGPLLDPEPQGTFLDAAAFHRLIKEKGDEVLLLDVRNDYEVSAGTFKGAIDPKTRSFGEFPKWLEANFAQHKNKPIVTFCTGGIRCEKATPHMKEQGFTEVYQLKGGILKFFEETLEQNLPNPWEGECIVFDKRIALDKSLQPTLKPYCFVCLTVLTGDNTSSEVFGGGTACQNCAGDMVQHRNARQEGGAQRAAANRQKRIADCRAAREKNEH